MEGLGEFASPYFEDEDPSQIVIISVSKKGGCRIRLMESSPNNDRKGSNEYLRINILSSHSQLLSWVLPRLC